MTLALDANPPPWETVVQGQGEALTMPVDAFLTLFHSEPEFRERVLAYWGALFAATTQSIACNRFRELSARTARWLLLMHDRLYTDEFRMTHQFMSLMLGVHRPGVTVALRTVAHAGIIAQTGRAWIRILDRQALQHASCECYERARGIPEL
jgi:CRP-like cAMP-binding protein